MDLTLSIVSDGSTSRVHGGLGLGVAIAHALTVMHEGELVAESEGVGSGAKFTLTLDLVPGASLAPNPESKKTHSLLGLENLIVEDSEDTLALLSTLFDREGAQVRTASSASEALERAVERRPDLVVSDIGMPDTDGFEFLRQLKGLEGLDDVPAIAISGYAGEDDRARALDVGYLALIPKPIDVEDLFGVINSVVQPAISSRS